MSQAIDCDGYQECGFQEFPVEGSVSTGASAAHKLGFSEKLLLIEH